MEIVVNNLNKVNENTTNNGTMLSVRTDAKPVAWKGIQGCMSFPTPVTIDEAIEAVGADYEVTKEHLIRVPDSLIQAIRQGDPHLGINITPDMIIESNMATVRKDRNLTLGVVGSKYGVVQNNKAFEFINLLTSGIEGHEKAVIETAGILGDGERMYVSAKLPSDIFIGNEGVDPISDYILFTNTHDGSGAVTVLFTPVRVVCQNSLNMALKMASNKLIYKHTLNVNKRLEWSDEENIKHAIEILERHKHFKETFKFKLMELQKQKITDNDCLKFASNVILNDAKKIELLEKANFNLNAVDEISNTIKNRIVNLRYTIESGIGQDMYKGTKLWLLNGLTTYFSNVKKYKTNEDKFNSIYDGTDLKKLNDAYALLTA